MLLPLTLLLFSWASVSQAGSFQAGQACTVNDNKLQIGTYQFYSQCDSQTYCNQTTGKCEKRGCRKDEFPFGYPQDDPNLPPLCPKNQFCPDEMDHCQPLLPVGSPCQLNRDDQCAPPPNRQELADTTSRGYNFNGSVCLNNVCMWANVTAGQPCVVENTAYIGYGQSSSSGEFINIVSRGNCKIGSYCDSQKLTCMANKLFNQACGADKECDSYNCLPSGVCGLSADTPNEFPVFIYVLVSIGIIGGMFGTLFAMYALHRRQRDRDREKRMQYWREQNAFRQNIIQMRDTASQILAQSNASTHSRRSSLTYSHDGAASVDSHTHFLSHAASRGSGLRHYLNDDSSIYDDGLATAEPMQIERRTDGRF